jgi:AcrR family transcriptional regulator
MPGTKDLTPAQERILVESEKVLGKKGISGLELKNIAKVLKIAPSTINYYYVSSEELIFIQLFFHITSMCSEFLMSLKVSQIRRKF